MTTISSEPPAGEEGVALGAPASRGCADRDKPWVLAATILGSSLAFIDSTVVNLALPAIQVDIAGSVWALQWIVNGYMLMLGALILVGGSAGDHFGRRRIFVIGIAVFGVASVLCGLSPDTTMLIAARILQGLGGAMLVPSSLAIISSSFPESERGKAIGTWAAFAALTTSIGPVLGGWLIDVGSWRLIFFINVPVALGAITIALLKTRESRSDNRGRIDWLGAMLAVLGLGAVTFGLTAVPDRGWDDAMVLASLLGGGGVLALFIRVEARSSSPMMPLNLFKSAPFSGTNMLTLLLYFALSGALFFLPFNLIQIQGYSATEAGAAFLPFNLVLISLSRFSGKMFDKLGARIPLIVGPLIASVGMALFAIPGIGGSYWSNYLPGMLVLGLGMSISIAPLTTTVMSSVPERYTGVASGINNAVARTAGLLAVAALGVVMVGVFAASLDTRLQDANIAAETRAALLSQASRLAEVQLPAELPSGERQKVTVAVHQSFIDSFRTVILINAALGCLSAVCTALTIKKRNRLRESVGSS